jgi:hypothetical protein
MMMTRNDEAFFLSFCLSRKGDLDSSSVQAMSSNAELSWLADSPFESHCLVQRGSHLRLLTEMSTMIRKPLICERRLSNHHLCISG